MVSCASHPSRILSPRPATGLGLRGITKPSSGTNQLDTNKTKKVQRALSTLFEESAYKSSPFFSVKGWLASPTSRHERRSTSSAIHPALARLRAQDLKDTPTLRKATPIKERRTTIFTTFGRHRVQGDLDALAKDMGTCQLNSALKAKEVAGPAQQLMRWQGTAAQLGAAVAPMD